MRPLLQAANILEAIVLFVGRTASWVILPLIAVIIFDIVTRKIYFTQQLILNNEFLHEYLSSTKLQDWEWHLHTVLFFLALGFAYSMNAHVRVDLIREKFSRTGQVWIEFLGCVLFLIPYLLVVLWFAWDFVVQSFESNEVSAAMTGLSRRWIIKSFIIGGLLLSLMAGVAVLLRKIVYLLGPAELRPEIKLHMLTEGGGDMGLPKIAEDTASVASKQEA